MDIFVRAAEGNAKFSKDILKMAFTRRTNAPLVELHGLHALRGEAKVEAKAEEKESDAAPQVEQAYFCSQLVAHLWQACGQLQPAVQPASFWPSALAEGGAVEEWLSPGVDLGPGAYVDWHAPEATYARKLRESQRHRGLSVFRG